MGEAKGTDIKMKFVNGLALEITQRCNNECKYCFSSSNPSITTEIPLNMLISIVDQYITMENKIAYERWENRRLESQIVITGGEPFLHSEWKSFFSYLTDIDEQFDVASNGILISEKDVVFLSETTIHDLQISLDGMREEDNILRNPQKTKLIIDKIRMLANSPLKSKLTVKATVSKYNVKHAQELIDFCKDIDVRLVFGYIQVLGRAALDTSYLLNSEEIKQFNRFIVENNPHLVLPLMFSHVPCPLDIDEEPLAFYISAEGDIYPCASFHESFFCIGNIYRDNLSQAIGGSRFKEIQNWVSERKEYMKSGPCKKCYVSDYCRGSCPAASYYEMHSDRIPPIRICEGAKKFNFYMLPKLLQNNVKFPDRSR